MNFLVCRVVVMAYLVEQTQYMLEKTFTFHDNTEGNFAPHHHDLSFEALLSYLNVLQKL